MPVTLRCAAIALVMLSSAASAQTDAASDSTRLAFAQSLVGAGRRLTQHAILVRGTRVEYDATVGGIELTDSSGRLSAIFTYTAYTRRGAGDAARRPITFAWNGGPSAASAGLHYSVLGPRRRAVDSAGRVLTPARLVDNPQSVLDRTDLVMVDPIGTGFSVAAGHGKLSDFYSLKGDAKSVGQFIERYLDENRRRESPLYILGQSYGTVRNALVLNVLQARGVSVSGVVFVSSALDGNTIWEASGHLEPNYFYLPTYAAIAWHHRKLPQQRADLHALIKEVEQFATTEFLTTLVAWPKVTPATRTRVLDKLHRYTGLSAAYWEQKGLRVGTVDFMQELLRAEKRVLTVNDGRQSSLVPTPGAPRPAATSGGGENELIRNYLRDELGVANAPEYRGSAPGANSWYWFDHGLRTRAPRIPHYQNFLDDLAMAMRANPSLRVQQHSGLFDLQCAAFPANWAMERMDIPDSLRRNVALFNYESGHAVYNNAPAAFLQFTANLAAFYDTTAASTGSRGSR